MRHILKILILLFFGTSVFGQGINPRTLEGTSIKGGILKGNVKIYDEAIGDSVWLYTHDTLLVDTNQVRHLLNFVNNHSFSLSGTPTRIPFFNTSSSLGTSADLYWDNTRSQLGIGTTNPNNYIYDGYNGIGIYDGVSARIGMANAVSTWIQYLSGYDFKIYNPNFGDAFKIRYSDGKWQGTGYTSVGTNKAAYWDVNGVLQRSDYDGVDGVGSAGYVGRWYDSNTQSTGGLYFPNEGGFQMGLGTTTPATYLQNGTSKGFAIHDASGDPRFSISNSTRHWVFYLMGNNLNIWANVGGELLTLSGNRRVGIYKTTPLNTLHVGGGIRMDNSTGTPTKVIGRDGNGDIGDITLGSGVSLTSGVLSATGSGGTVTSVGVANGGGLTVSGSPITTSGTITITADDTSPTNELNHSIAWNDATDSLQIVDAGGIKRVKITGFGTGDGTVESVGIATGTTGTDVNVSGSPITTSGTITVNIPTASATNRGALSSADWTTFNNKENAIAAGTTAQYWRGDKTWQTLNTSVVPEGSNLYFTNARARTAISLTTSGTSGAATYNSSTGVLNVPNYTFSGITGTGVNGRVAFWNGTSSLNSNNLFFWDDGNSRLGLGTNAPTARLDVDGAVRLRTSANTPTNIMGRDGSGYVANVSIGTGLSLSGGTLTNTSLAPNTWADLSGNIVSWNSTGVFNSGKPVGIGDGSPTRLLDVNGDVRFRGRIYDSGNSSGSSGQVLTSYGAGNWGWSTPSGSIQNLSYNIKSGSDVYLDISGGGAGVNLSDGKGIVLDRVASNKTTFSARLPYGSMRTTSDYTNTSVGSSEIKIPFSTSTTSQCNSDVTFNSSNNRLIVGTAGVGMYRVSFECDIVNQSTNDYTLEVYARRSGGSVIPASVVNKKVVTQSSVDIEHTFTKNFVINIPYNNDYIELFVKRVSGSGDKIIVKNVQLTMNFISIGGCAP